jgi:23S rRNA pseudouridine2605 synthase
MLAKLNHKVMRLRRVAIGPVRLDRLPKGKSRKLALPEIEALRKVAARAKKPVGTDLRSAQHGPGRAPDHAPESPTVKARTDRRSVPTIPGPA